ncbi:YiiD C-terminal domain-containing protein [Colwelliaceae bacterium MEBiC 14330]
MYVCRSPKTAQEFQQYYQLRWQVLRKPWQQAFGSEKDELEQDAIHLMIIDEHSQVIAVGRLDKASQFSGRIRYMAVHPDKQGQGLGKQLINALENRAQQLGIKELTLKAREQALAFYQRLGYAEQGFSHLLFDEIKHFSMNKSLAYHADHQQVPATALQQTWHKTIPLSKVMNIQISYYDGQQLICHCDNSFNKNLHNTMFAGSIYTLATLTGWGWVFLQLENLGLSGDIVLANADIKYHAPIKGVAYAKVIAEQVVGDYSVLNSGRNARIQLTTHLYCGDNVAATFTGNFAVLANKNNS